MIGIATDDCFPSSPFIPQPTKDAAFFAPFLEALVAGGSVHSGEARNRELVYSDVVFRLGSLGPMLAARPELQDSPPEPAIPTALGQSVGSGEAITEEARSFSRARGLVGSLVLVRQLIQDQLPPMTPIRIALERDPEIAGYKTLLFNISIDESPERLIALDDQLQDSIFNHIPPKHRRYFLFRYGLE